MSKMSTIIPANPPPKGSLNRRVTMDKSGINTKGTNIQVVLRCKGNKSYNAQQPGSPSILEFMESKDTNIGQSSASQDELSRSIATKPVTDVLLNTNNTIYSFDHVFKPEETQAAVYKDVAEPILNDVLAGYSCTIFAYGQTGTGKTFTMEGDLTETEGCYSKNAGIIPRTIHDLFEKLPTESHVTVSMLELYNEELRDLLCASDNQKSLKIFEENGTAKVNCQEYNISSVSGGLDIMKIGVRKRMTAATNCNEQSSRSHCIFTLTVHTSKKTDKGEDVISTGKLNLVDLAGSENNRSSGSENMRAREAASINRSLLTLGRVINCLVDKTPHIPYRESKLTRILKDSLGGNTKTCIIATVAPAIQNQEEIRSTLDYASHAKGICNQPRSNNVINRERHLDSLVSTIEQLQNELRVNYEKNGVFMTKKTYEQKNEEFLRLKSSFDEIMAQNKTLSSLIDGKDKMIEEEKRKRKEEVEEERRRRKEEVEEERRRRKEDAEARRNEYIDLLVKYRNEHMNATEKHWEHYLAEAKQQTAKALTKSTRTAMPASIVVPSISSTAAAVVPSAALTAPPPPTATTTTTTIASKAMANTTTAVASTSSATASNSAAKSSNIANTTISSSPANTSHVADTETLITNPPTAPRATAARATRLERISPVARPISSQLASSVTGRATSTRTRPLPQVRTQTSAASTVRRIRPSPPPSTLPPTQTQRSIARPSRLPSALTRPTAATTTTTSNYKLLAKRNNNNINAASKHSNINSNNKRGRDGDEEERPHLKLRLR